MACPRGLLRAAGKTGGEEGAFGVVVGQVERLTVGVRGSPAVAEAAEQVGLDRRQVAVAGEVSGAFQGLDLAERVGRAVNPWR
jgi:hypothetical protein